MHRFFQAFWHSAFIQHPYLTKFFAKTMYCIHCFVRKKNRSIPFYSKDLTRIFMRETAFLCRSGEMMHHFAFSLLSISSLKLRRWHDRNILFICTFEGEVKYCVCSRWNVQVTSHANIVIPRVRFSRLPIGISNMTMKFHASVKFDLLQFFSLVVF